MRFIFILLIIFLVYLSAAQNNDAVIHDDFTSLNISGKKGAFIYFTITRTLKVKIISEKGLQEFKEIKLPVNFDPTFMVHAPVARNVGFYLSRLKVEFFETKIIRENGPLTKDDYTPEITSTKSVNPTDDFYETYYTYDYTINELKVGDELEIRYRYNFPFDQNFYKLSSMRFFFHGKHYKEHQKLRLTLSTELIANLVYANGAEPDSLSEIRREKVYVWENHELPGCLDEPESRPYRTLPYVILSIKPWELLYTVPYTYKETFVPFYAIAASFRERRHLDILRAVDLGVHTRQYEKLDKFLREKATAGPEDSTGYENLFIIHNLIAEDFSFENDTEYFNNFTPYDEKLGDYALGGTIRDISRFTLYVALVSKLGFDHFTAYIADKRMGEITGDFFAPMFENDYFIAPFLSTGKIKFILPKSSRYGLYLNEFPFYYENAPVRLVLVNDYANYKTAIKDNFRSVNTPSSDILDNLRTNSILGIVNLNDKTISFEAAVDLAGQFSTLTRGVYLYDVFDTTINPLYKKKVWEIHPEISLKEQEIKVLQKEFPFRTNVKAKYSSDDMITNRDSIYRISCNGWVNHVVQDRLDTLDRHLDFYTDFMGRDTYVYFLKFNQDIKLVGSSPNIHLINEYGEYSFKIEPADNQSVKLTSFLSINQDQVPAKEIGSIARIFEAAKMQEAFIEVVPSGQ